MPVTDEQAALLRLIADRIEGHPTTFNMKYLLQNVTRQHGFELPENCRTTACIAGYVLLHDGYRWFDPLTWVAPDGTYVTNSDAVVYTRDRLGRTDDALFYAENWPEAYQDRLRSAGIHLVGWCEPESWGPLSHAQQAAGAQIAASLLRALADGEELVFRPYSNG